MNVKLKAPRNCGSTSIAAASTERSGRAAISAVTRSESVVEVKAPGTPASAARGGLVEDLADQAQVLVDDDRGAVGDGDARRLLAAVLQGVETEVGQLGDLLPRRPDAEDATGVLGSRGMGVEVVRQPSITARHICEGTGVERVRPAGRGGPD